MLLSLSLVFLCGMAFAWVFKKLRMPSLLGMLITGFLLGPYALNLLDDKILSISQDLRQLALIIILARAGLNMDISDLKAAGRPAFLLCFVPACFEVAATLLFAPLLLGVSLLDAAIMGSVIAAVSPAVVVPRMLKLMEKGYGTQKRIPQMIMAGASVDDVFVIVLFSVLVRVASGEAYAPAQLLALPSAILLGLAGGIAVGWVLSVFFTKVHIRDTGKVVIILSLSFMLVELEQTLQGAIGFSGLLAVMATGTVLRNKKLLVSRRLSSKFSKLWVAAELLLFVLVGAAVDIRFAVQAGFAAVVLILLAATIRFVGVQACLIGTDLNCRERLFTGFAYLPKATVQAAIGGIPLAMGLSGGNMVLTVAVLSIMLTAPLGAALIDMFHKQLLVRDDEVV